MWVPQAPIGARGLFHLARSRLAPGKKSCKVWGTTTSNLDCNYGHAADSFIESRSLYFFIGVTCVPRWHAHDKGASSASARASQS